MKAKSGFTLIELLVVISIIGMLSSVVLAALSSARAKAGISASLSFDTNIYMAMGDTLIGYWQLNDGAVNTSADGASIKDSSISNFSGTVIADGTIGTIAGASWMNGVNGGSSLNFSRDAVLDKGQVVRIPVSKSYGTDITVSTWINMPINNVMHWWLVGRGVNYNKWDLLVDTGRIIKFSGNSLAATPNIACNSSVLTLGVWHNIVATNSDGTATLYVDGKICAGPTSGITIDNTNSGNSNIYIGGVWWGSASGDFFNGQIDTVRLYTQAITAKQVQELYASELGAHSFAKK